MNAFKITLPEKLPPDKLPTTNTTNKLNDAIRSLIPIPTTGQIEEPPHPSGPIILKLTGDAFKGGRYWAVKGIGEGKPTNDVIGALTLPEPGVTFGTNKVYADNLREKGLSIHLLPIDESMIVTGWLSGSVGGSSGAELYNIDVVPPLTLQCTPVGSGTNAFIYDLRRFGDPTAQLLAHNASPSSWRTFNLSGTSLIGLLISATETHYKQSGTGVVMTDCNEKWNLNPCSTSPPPPPY